MAKKYALTLQAQLKNTKSIEQEILAVKKKWEREGLTNVKIAVKTDNGAIKSMTASVKDMAGGSRRATAAINQVNGELKTTETVTTGVAKATKTAAKNTNYFGKGMLDAAKTAAKYAMGLGLIYKAMAEIGRGVQYIKSLDKEMRDIQIVAGYTDEQIKELATDYNELAKAMGATTLEVASGSLEWTRQGKSIAETQELLRSTLMLSKLGNVEAAESTEYLTSTLNGFKMEAQDAEGVVDKLVAVDNAAATSVKELATALQKSSVSAQAAGVDFDTLVAYIGTVSSITRLSAETVGTSFKTMFARFQDIKEGAIDGEGAINNVERALGRLTLASGEQMSILDRQTGEFKEFSVVIEQLAGQWDTLSEMEQANIVKAFAGVRQRESFLALMENQAMMHSLLAEEMNSEGLAAERYGTYLEGLEAAQNKATAAWEGMVQATVEGGLVKWFYDAQAGLFGFIEKLGGLDALLPMIVAGLISYATYAMAASGATLTLAGSMTALAGILETIQILVMLNPLGALIALTGVLITELIAFKKTSDEITKDLGDNWSDAMAEVASSTQGTGEILKEFEKDVKFLEGLSAWEKLWIDESKLLDEGLKNTLKLLETNTSGWREYKEGIEKAAESAGYLIDEQGKLYTEYFNGNKVVRHYAEGLDTLTHSEMNAGAEAEDLAEKIERVGTASSASEAQVLAFTESFNQFLEAAYTGMEGTSEETDNLFAQLGNINRQFQEGTIDVETYFEQLEDSLENVDMTSMFGGDEESAEMFFSGVVSNAAEALRMINTDFADGEMSITNYTEQLAELGDVFEQIGSIAEHFDLGDAVNESLGEIIGGVEELRQAQETNIIVQETLRQITEDGLQFEAEAYAKQVGLAAAAMAQSGIIYKDHQGNILKGSEQLREFMMRDAGNFQHLADQTANATGMSINKVVQAAGKMLMALGTAISSFDATIAFRANVVGETALPGLAGMMGLSLPDVDYNITASSTGLAEIGAAISSFGEGLASSGIGINMDASIFTQGFPSAQQEFEDLENTAGSLANALREIGKASGKSTSEIEKDAKSIDALLAMVIAKIRQEQEARKDALKERLKGFKEVIDKRKELLRAMKDEHDYNNKLKDNQKDLANIQSEMIELRLDDSEEAKARLRQLEEEAARIQKEIDENAYERSVELQEVALNKRYEKFKKNIEKQIALIDAYLDRPGQIMRDALKMIDKEGSKLYKELIEWNGIYGTGIDNDVTAAWEEAMKALEKYKKGLAELTGNKFAAIIPPPLPEEFSSNALESVPTPEYASSPPPMGENANSPLSIDKFMDINVAGNLDSSVVPEIEKIVDKAIGKLNDAMRDRGFGQRGASQFSI